MPGFFRLNLPSIFATLVVAFAADSLHAATLVYDFSNGSGGLIDTNSTGFSTNISGGVATFSNVAGAGNGRSDLTTPYTLAGDFTASVVANRPNLGNAELGIEAGTNAASLVDLFFTRSDLVGTNVFRPSIGTVFNDTNTAVSMTLTLSRAGDTITETYDDGTGHPVSYSETSSSYAGSVDIHLFLIEEFGDTGAHSGSFNSLTLTAPDVPAPEPTTAAFLATPALALLRRRKK